MSSETSPNIKALMGGRLAPESNGKGKGKGKGEKGKEAPASEAPAAPVASPPVNVTPPPAAPAPLPADTATATLPPPAAPAPDPLDVPFVLNAGLGLACGTIPEATRKATSQVSIPPQVMVKVKGIIGKPDATPQAIADALVTFAGAAADVLGLANADTFLMAIEQGLEREHKEGIATAKAKRAQEEALRRAKVRDDLQKGITGLAISDLPKGLIDAVNAAQKEGLFLVIHGPLDPTMANDKQAQGAGIYVRDKASAPARAPKASTGEGTGGDDKPASHKYYDDSKGGAEVTIALSKYLTDTYPASATVKVMTDLDARRKAGETQSRISAWDAYQKGLKASPPDTFVIRRVEGK